MSCRAWMRRTLGVLVAVLVSATTLSAAEVDVRIRFAWGGSGQTMQKWQGRITVPGAALRELQPLGIEADEAAALQLVGDEVRVAPLVRRAFEGCDVSIRGDEAAVVKVELRYSAESPVKVVEVPLGEVARDPFRAPLDDLGGHVLIHRAPGDKLRVRIDRPHLVFSPGETVQLQLMPDLQAEAAESPLTLKATLHRTGAAAVLQEVAKPYDGAAVEPVAFEFTAPSEEGAYRIKLSADRPAGIASRLVPWERKPAAASREVEFVVVDPAARLPQFSASWETVSTIDPANSSWWQRIPSWTQFDKLPAFTTPRPLGNVRPTTLADSPSGLVELPPFAPEGEDPTIAPESAWQAYLLPVRHIDEPHAVEIEIPRGVRQHLGVSLVEPDAAGRVMSFGRDGGVYSEEIASADPAVEVHRIVFWPRTKSPLLLLANRSTDRPVQYGKIRLLRRTVAAAPAIEVGDDAPAGRLVAAYIGAPRFAETLGAAEELDAVSGMSVDGWNTFLSAANRLAQQLRASGYNAAIVSIAADGGSLAPVEGLGASPRFDTGLLSTVAADPYRKDVLEVLLRVFDREGLKLIPAIQLATPLPRLEAMAAASPAIRWVGRDGQPWSSKSLHETAAGSHYNILHSDVQSEIGSIADRLVQRYGSHASLAGLAVQLAGNGYAALPGLAWGMDDATAERFAADTETPLEAEGPTRYQQRAAILLGQRLPAWKQWRQDQLSQFYAALAARVTRDRPTLQLVLCTEDLFTGQAAGERLRQAVSGRASLDDPLAELGVNLNQLAATPGVSVLRPRRLAAEDSVDSRAADQRINGALELDQALAASPRSGELFYQSAARLRLPSFDIQSPFGADRTFLTLNAPAAAAGDAARQSLVAALATRDFTTLAAGAESLPLDDNDAFTEALRVFNELPVAAVDVRSERRQPVTLRVYREATSTTICLVNESRWPVTLDLPLEADADLVWRQLGVDPSPTAAAGTRGSLARGAQTLSLTLPPYGLHARRYSSRTLRVGSFTPQVASAAAADLARRVAEIEQRMTSLNVERPYSELQNPQFELVDDAGRLRGWQPRMGERGAVNVSVDDTTPVGRSVHLHSEDALGVAVQSHLFDIPATGQVVVRARVRAADMQPGAQLYAWVEYETASGMRQRYAALGDQTLGSNWIDCEFAMDDLPLATDGKMRVQFHLTGSGDVWIDDVRLFDLRFADAQRVELSKRLLGAKAALEDGNLMDCQRLVDGYLPRRLVAHVPPPIVATQTDVALAPAPATPEKKGITPRIRGMVPRILR